MPKSRPAAPPAAAAFGQRAALAGGILLFWPGFASPYFAPKLLACSGGVALAWLGLARARRPPLAFPVLALLAAAVAAAAMSVDPAQSVYGDARQPFYGLAQLALYAAAYWLGASADEALVDDGLDALTWAALGCAALAAVQLLGVLPQRWAHMDGRLIGPTGNPAFFGAVAALLWPICLSRASRSRAARAAAWALPAAILLTWTRGAWLAAAAGGATWLAASGRARARAWWALAAVGALCAVLVAGRLLGRGSSDVARAELWRAAVRAALERPASGYGPDNYQLALRKLKTERYVKAIGQLTAEQSSAHNDLLQAAATLGLPGLAAYLWLLAAAAAMLRRACLAPDERAAAAAGALAALFVVAKFNPVTPDACAAAAWLAGAAGPRGEPRPRGPALLLSALALAAAGLLAASEAAVARSRRALAQGRALAALASAETAAALTPGRLAPVVARCEALVQAAQAGVGDPRAFAARALEQARRAARRHPGNPQAHELAGTIALFVGVSTGERERLTEALASLGEASRLSPFHPYAARRRLEAARALGAADEARRAAADLEALEALVPSQSGSP